MCSLLATPSHVGICVWGGEGEGCIGTNHVTVLFVNTGQQSVVLLPTAPACDTLSCPLGVLMSVCCWNNYLWLDYAWKYTMFTHAHFCHGISWVFVHVLTCHYVSLWISCLLFFFCIFNLQADRTEYKPNLLTSLCSSPASYIADEMETLNGMAWHHLVHFYFMLTLLRNILSSVFSYFFACFLLFRIDLERNFLCSSWL